MLSDLFHLCNIKIIIQKQNFFNFAAKKSKKKNFLVITHVVLHVHDIRTVVQFLEKNSLLTPFLISLERAFLAQRLDVIPSPLYFPAKQIAHWLVTTIERIDVAISCAFNELFLVVEISILRERSNVTINHYRWCIKWCRRLRSRLRCVMRRSQKCAHDPLCTRDQLIIESSRKYTTYDPID